jgi:protein TonB
MFDQTFVDGTQKTKNKYTIALSLLLQCAIIGVLILIPLIYTETLPTAQLKSMLVAPAPPPPPPPPPPPAAPKPVQKPVVKQFVANQLLAPKVIPKTINKIEEAAPPPDVSAGVVGGTGDPSGAAGGVLGGVLGGVPSAAPPPPPPPKAKPSGPVRIGGQVMAAKITKQVQPVYPPLAKSARVSGTVEFTAVIDKEGNIKNLQLVRGHPLLVAAARDAVLQWKYKPTELNGQPVEVVTSIIVNFNLSQ